MGPAGRFNPKPCKVCNGLSKSKCYSCGHFFNLAKKDMTPWEIVQYDSWVEYIEYLKSTRHKMVTTKMLTSGCVTLDKKIIENLGDWRTGREYLQYLQQTYDKLVKNEQQTTGHEELDNEILKYIGDWRVQITSVV